jgi:hypothetical protein
MNRTITIVEVANGYQVTLEDQDAKMEYVYPATAEFTMLEAVGRWLLRSRIKVQWH